VAQNAGVVAVPVIVPPVVPVTPVVVVVVTVPVLDVPVVVVPVPVVPVLVVPVPVVVPVGPVVGVPPVVPVVGVLVVPVVGVLVVPVVGVPVVPCDAAVSAVSLSELPPQAASAAVATPIVKTLLRVMVFAFMTLRSDMVPPMRLNLYHRTAPRHASLLISDP